MKLVISVFLFTIFTSVVAAQTPVPTPDDDDVIRIKSNLVQLDAVVVDSKGHQVTDLTASDFEIVESGKKRVPDHFAYISLAGTKTSEPDAKGQNPQMPGRVFVFVVSNPIIEFAYSMPAPGGRAPVSGTINTQARAVRAADATHSMLKWFVDSEMTDNDLAAIADIDSNIGVLSSFTNDRDVLRTAIETVRANTTNGKSPVIRIMAVGTDLSLQSLVQHNLSIMQTLENVIAQVESLPGRKVVTLVARGMLYNPNLPYSNVIKERLARLIQKANRAQISIYTVQARDLSPSGSNMGSDGLIALAQETGGRAIYNTNDIKVGFDQIVEENRGYYLLAYNPGADAEGRPHRLQLNVKRPGLKVLTRSEAYSRPAVRPQRHVLDSPLTSRDIEMDLKAVASTKAKVQFSWRIDLNNVETSAVSESEEFSLDLFARVTGPEGNVLKRTDRNTTFMVKRPDVENARREGVASKFEFAATKSGYYRIDVGVRDVNSGKTGRLTKFVKVD